MFQREFTEQPYSPEQTVDLLFQEAFSNKLLVLLELFLQKPGDGEDPFKSALDGGLAQLQKSGNIPNTVKKLIEGRVQSVSRLYGQLRETLSQQKTVNWEIIESEIRKISEGILSVLQGRVSEGSQNAPEHLKDALSTEEKAQTAGDSFSLVVLFKILDLGADWNQGIERKGCCTEVFKSVEGALWGLPHDVAQRLFKESIENIVVTLGVPSRLP